MTNPDAYGAGSLSGVPGTLSQGQALSGIGAGAAALAGPLMPIVTTLLQGRENRKLAEYQASANERYLDKYNEYNTPVNQMKRFQDAGLNPNLIYGQGTAGNQSAPLQYPDIKPRDFSTLMNMVPMYNQMRMTDSQVQAIDAKTRQTGVLTALNELQTQVLAKNPLLDDEGFKATINGLKSAAEIKASQAATATETANWFTGEKTFMVDGVQMHGPAGVIKMETELKKLVQQFDLGTQDMRVKSEILKSKEFQNAILEVQKKWLADGEMGPAQFYQLIQFILMKAF